MYKWVASRFDMETKSISIDYIYTYLQKKEENIDICRAPMSTWPANIKQKSALNVKGWKRPNVYEK